MSFSRIGSKVDFGSVFLDCAIENLNPYLYNRKL